MNTLLSAPQRPGRLEDEIRAEQVRHEREAVVVLDDDVVVGDDAEGAVGVLTHGGVVAGDRLAARAEQRLLGDGPGQPGRVERRGERARALVEHNAQAMPGHAPDAHHRVGLRDAVSHMGSPPWVGRKEAGLRPPLWSCRAASF
jgi:hypothetical protein